MAGFAAIESLEVSLLSVCLCDPTGYAIASAAKRGISTEHFTDSRCKVVWEAMQELGATDSGDPGLLAANIRAGGKNLDNFVSELIDGGVDVNADQYARLIIEAHLRRDVSRRIIQLSELAASMSPEQIAKHAAEIAEKSAAITQDETEANEKHLRVETISELFSRTNVPLVSIVGDGLLDESGIMLLHAPPKKGKSLLAIWLATCLATGKPFLHFPINRPRRVVYVNAEINAHRFRGRLAKPFREMAPDDVVRMEENFFSASRPELDLATPIGFAILRRMVEKISPALVVIDPVSSVWFGKENESEAVSAFFASLRHLTATSKTSLLLCHHSAKAAAMIDGNFGGRGSGVWSSAPETLITMARKKNSENVSVLTIAGTNIVAEFCVKYDPENGSFVGVADGLETPLESEQAEMIWATLSRLKGGLSKAQIMAETRLSESSFDRGLSFGKNAGWIVTLKRGGGSIKSTYSIGLTSPNERTYE